MYTKDDFKQIGFVPAPVQDCDGEESLTYTFSDSSAPYLVVSRLDEDDTWHLSISLLYDDIPIADVQNLESLQRLIECFQDMIDGVGQ